MNLLITVIHNTNRYAIDVVTICPSSFVFPQVGLSPANINTTFQI